MYIGKRLDPNDPAFAGWDDDSPLPRPTQVAQAEPTVIWDDDEPDENDPSITWPDKPSYAAPQPAQPTTQAHTTGYKPATDADMRAMMQDIEQSLK